MKIVSVIFFILFFAITLNSQDWKKMYDEIGLFHGDLAIARKNNKFGYVNREGEIVIPFSFDCPEEWVKDGLTIFNTVESAKKTSEWFSFSNDAAIVFKNGKWGMINKKGEEIVSILYDKIYPFENGLALAQYGSFGSLEREYGFFDTYGNKIIPVEFYEILTQSHGIDIDNWASGSRSYEGRVMEIEKIIEKFDEGRFRSIHGYIKLKKVEVKNRTHEIDWFIFVNDQRYYCENNNNCVDKIEVTFDNKSNRKISKIELMVVLSEKNNYLYKRKHLLNIDLGENEAFSEIIILDRKVHFYEEVGLQVEIVSAK